jgi:hypothetical protein
MFFNKKYHIIIYYRGKKIGINREGQLPTILKNIACKYPMGIVPDVQEILLESKK